jgi:hypothetical protein
VDISFRDDVTVILLIGVSFEGIWEWELEEKRVWEREILMHCKKRIAVFPSPAGMSLTKLSLAWNN